MNRIELDRLTEEFKKDRDVRVRAGGIVTLSLFVFFLSALAVFAGCGGKGGPTGPGGDECTGLQGGNPVGRWSNQKSPPFVKEYRPDGAYWQNGAPRGIWRADGNKLVYNGLYPEETYQYFEVAGNTLTTCYSDKKFYFYKE